MEETHLNVKLVCGLSSSCWEISKWNNGTKQKTFHSSVNDQNYGENCELKNAIKRINW